MHFPSTIASWSVFGFGLLLVAFRIHGIDAPRTWIEWVERRFIYMMALRFVGAILLVLAITVLLVAIPQGLLAPLFYTGMAALALAGFGLLFVQNHVRLLLFATAESTDMKIRVSSAILTLIGLGFMVAPFFW
jgi:uncharacterized membrane protein